MDRIVCFPPIIDENAKVLILGTMPGEESVRKLEYYGNRTNVFWRIMCELTGFDVENTYEERVENILKHGIAVWDTIHSCLRKGSLDKDITDIKYNDIGKLLEKYPKIERVFCDSRAAEKFLKEGGSVLPEGVEVEYLCSTSGAFPRSYEYKLNEWKRLLDFIG